MTPKHTVNTAASVRHRQIGRKVLKADHLAHALGARPKKRSRIALPRIPAMRPKLVAAVCAAVLLVAGLGMAGAQYYFAKTAEAQKVAEAKHQVKLRANSIAAEACRRQKLAEKADQIGKITYAELYDGNACDK